VLGKGLSALLPSRSALEPVASAANPPGKVALSAIQENPFQPRTNFASDALEELAQSIRVNGIIQPLIVRQRGHGYQLVAGERRWRAAKLAGLHEVPVHVQDVADDHMLELALIENTQREDLNPIETARALERLHRELGLNQEEIARRTGKERATIANLMRLLRLPVEVQQLVENRKLSMGQARAVLGLQSANEQVQLAEKAAAQGLSVRQVEALVQQASQQREPSAKKDRAQDPNIRAAVDELSRALGTRVRIVELTDQRGRIEIEYYSQAELDRLYSALVGSPE
jgi:ParB family chromosome partitioning protein